MLGVSLLRGSWVTGIGCTDDRKRGSCGVNLGEEIRRIRLMACFYRRSVIYCHQIARLESLQNFQFFFI
jgi:hypothetical protein